MSTSTKVATCVGCGCTDLSACREEDGFPCHWLRCDRERGFGVCSSCPELLRAWDRNEGSSKGQGAVVLSMRSRLGRLKRIWGVRHVRYWLMSRELYHWWEQYEGPGIVINQADLDFLDAVWRGEA